MDGHSITTLTNAKVGLNIWRRKPFHALSALSFLKILFLKHHRYQKQFSSNFLHYRCRQDVCLTHHFACCLFLLSFLLPFCSCLLLYHHYWSFLLLTKTTLIRQTSLNQIFIYYFLICSDCIIHWLKPLIILNVAH